MNSILAIAKNTFKEAVRNRILYLILFFALIMIGSSGAIGQLTISAHDKIIKDLGFSAINLFGVAIAVFVGVSLVYNEIEKKTIYTIVSKPIDRWQFILGKFLGLLMTVYVNLLVMTLFFLFMIHYYAAQAADAGWLAAVAGASWKAFANLFWWNGFPATANIMLVVFATALELAIITSFAILYSSFSTPTLSMVFTVLTFLAGRLNEDLIAFAENLAHRAEKLNADLPFSYYFAQAASLVTPNLGVFHRTVDQAIYGDQTILWPESIAYALVYPAAILFLSMLIFSRRNFK